MCYPFCYGDMVHLFAMPLPVISMMTNKVLDCIYATHVHRIQQWNHQLLSPQNLEYFTNNVHRKGAPLDNCLGFIDGLFLGQNATKELSTTDINVSMQSNSSQS